MMSEMPMTFDVVNNVVEVAREVRELGPYLGILAAASRSEMPDEHRYNHSFT